MEKGTILYLNGVTSAGKTSIVEALRGAGADFYYLSDDIFEDHIIDVEYGSPAYWETMADAVFLMYRTAKLFSQHGKTVVIDSMLLEHPAFKPHYSKMLAILEGCPLHVVQVACDLEICRKRNLLRPDRYELQSQEQAELMAQNVQYALQLDTGVLTPDECAQRILPLLK